MTARDPLTLAERAGLVLLMFAAALLLRALSFVPAVIDTDEGLYIVQARAWLAGGWPLITVWDMHPIGAPALVSLAMAIFGQSIAAVRLLGAIAVAATGAALCVLARALGLPREAALGAGMLSIALTTLFGGLATNTEILFAPFIVAALAVAMRAEAPQWRALVPMGLLVGVALTIKPVAVAEGCFAFAVLVGPPLWQRRLPLARLSGLAAGYALLCAAPTGVIALAYAGQGAFGVFLDVWFAAPFRYAGAALPLADAAWMVLAAVLFLLWPIALALAGVGLGGDGRRAFGFAGTWFAVASLAVALPGMFFNHYFLIVLPPVSLLAAAGGWRLAQRVAPTRTAALFAALIALAGFDAWVGDAARRIETGVGIRRPDPVRAVATALRGIAPPGTVVFIANYHPVVYALADASLPTRFVFPAQLTGGFGAVLPVDADTEVARILASRPRVIVVDRGWWTAMRPSVRAMLAETLAQAYTLEASIAEERGPVELHRLTEGP